MNVTFLSGSSSHRLAGVALAPGRAGSLPVAVPVATGGGLKWVSSGRFSVPARTLRGRDLRRERGQVERGVVVPVQPVPQDGQWNSRSARVSLARTAPHAEQ